MALVQEDGSRVSNANTYILAADAESYFDLVGKDRTAWDALSTAEQEAAIIRAAQYLEGTYGERFGGYKATKDQALLWPRYDVYEHGWLVGSTTIPERLQHAQAALAYRTLDGTALAKDVTASAQSGSVVRRKEKVGPLEVDTTYQEGTDLHGDDLYQEVEQLLAPLLTSSDDIVELERA